MCILQPSSASGKEKVILVHDVKWKQTPSITVQEVLKSTFNDKTTLELKGHFTGDDRVPRIFFHYQINLVILYFLPDYLSDVISQTCKKAMLPSQLCWSHFCIVLFIRMFRKDSFLFGLHNKIATNGNDSQTVLCSQRITHQNTEGADFCGGNSAGPFFLTETSSAWEGAILLGSPGKGEPPFSPCRNLYPPCALCFHPLFPSPLQPYLNPRRTSMRISKQHKKGNQKVK